MGLMDNGEPTPVELSLVMMTQGFLLNQSIEDNMSLEDVHKMIARMITSEMEQLAKMDGSAFLEAMGHIHEAYPHAAEYIKNMVEVEVGPEKVAKIEAEGQAMIAAMKNDKTLVMDLMKDVQDHGPQQALAKLRQKLLGPEDDRPPPAAAEPITEREINEVVNMSDDDLLAKFGGLNKQ